MENKQTESSEGMYGQYSGQTRSSNTSTSGMSGQQQTFQGQSGQQQGQYQGQSLAGQQPSLYGASATTGSGVTSEISSLHGGDLGHQAGQASTSGQFISGQHTKPSTDSSSYTAGPGSSVYTDPSTKMYMGSSQVHGVGQGTPSSSSASGLFGSGPTGQTGQTSTTGMSHVQQPMMTTQSSGSGQPTMTTTTGQPQYLPVQGKNIVVHRQSNAIEMYEGTNRIARYSCVVGTGESTPLGEFKVQDKVHQKRFVPNTDKPLPWALKFTDEWHAIHGTGHAVAKSWAQYFGLDSMGTYNCVGLSDDNAKHVFEWADVGTNVSIRND